MRINRFLARCGVSSRRKAEELIIKGSVFVNGAQITELNTNIDASKDQVTVNGKAVALPKLKYYLLNKPEGYTVTKNDKHAKKTVFELIPKDNSLFSVGRLDRDTTGLLIVTNDGVFAQNMIHPSKKIQKEYEVTLKTPITKEQITKLKSTLNLDDGPAKAVSVRKISDSQVLLVIEEGRNRIVRRMIKAVGNEVIRLNRARIGEITLDIPKGKYRELTDKEISDYV